MALSLINPHECDDVVDIVLVHGLCTIGRAYLKLCEEIQACKWGFWSTSHLGATYDLDIHSRQQAAKVPRLRATHDLMRSELDNLRQGVKSSLQDVQRYLSLGFFGVCKILDEKDLEMEASDLTFGWKYLYQVLLALRGLLLKLEKILISWEKVLYISLLFSAFSEFPNRLRPPCTTMPWTIWPALVVLWGVCWMFYELCNPDWEDSLFDNENSGHQFQAFSDLILVSGWNSPERSAPYPTDLDWQAWDDMGNPATETLAPTSTGLAPPSYKPNPQGTLGSPDIIGDVPGRLVVATGAVPYSTTSRTPEATGERQLEATNTAALGTLPTSPPAHEQPLDVVHSITTATRQSRPSQNSKHGRLEKYFCPHSDCDRSQPGKGFPRKDHLDQHLRGKHKELPTPRVRAIPETVRNSSHIVQSPSQSKKRKRGGDGQSGTTSLDEDADDMIQQLAEERKLRLLAEKENARLRQEVEKYKERMEKCEERMERKEERMEKREGRLERMMTSFEKHQEEDTETT